MFLIENVKSSCTAIKAPPCTNDPFSNKPLMNDGKREIVLIVILLGFEAPIYERDKRLERRARQVTGIDNEKR